MSSTDKDRHSNNDKLAEVHDRLVAAIEDLVSGEDWRAFLEASQRLHAYSASNVLLIITQFPGATRVGGYRTWKGLGYQVRRGEKGIAVLAPIVGWHDGWLCEPGSPKRPLTWAFLERTTGFEPATLTLARRPEPSVWCCSAL